jgi:hypothetical protein
MATDTKGQARRKVVTRPVKQPKLTVEFRYQQFFVPQPPSTWPQNDDNFSLEQPSPLKWVPTETTYGINVPLSH